MLLVLITILLLLSLSWTMTSCSVFAVCVLMLRQVNDDWIIVSWMSRCWWTAGCLRLSVTVSLLACDWWTGVMMSPEVAQWLLVLPAGAASWLEAPWWAQQWEFPASETHMKATLRPGTQTTCCHGVLTGSDTISLLSI